MSEKQRSAKDDIDLMFIMGLYPEDMEQEISNNSIYGIQNAANVFQWNIVRGVISTGISKVGVTNSLYIGSYPKKYKTPFVRSYKFPIGEGIEGDNVGYMNIPVLKEFFRYWTMKPYLKAWALDGNSNKVAFAYAATFPMTTALEYIKRINPEICTCLAVPDLPAYMNLSQRREDVLHRVKNYIVRKKMTNVDSYLLLTQQMQNAIPGAENKPVTIVEGMVSDYVQKNELETYTIEKFGLKERRYFLYSGTLNIQYGVIDLIEAYRKSNVNDIELAICGEGEAAVQLKAFEKEDQRIHFLEQRKYEEVIFLQKHAMALVNPRKNKGEYTRYSFPSKNMEYITSGIPTIAYLLDGMPTEYKDYIICIQDNKQESFINALESVVRMNEAERIDFGKRAQSFVRTEKNAQKQMKKVIEMFERFN